MADNFTDFLPGVQDLFSAFRTEFGGEPADPADFREQAERESGTFFDKDLALAMKEITQARTQAKEAKELAERQETESFTEFQGVQDRSFARTLGRASGRFAGKGTATSGARREALGDFFEGKEDTLEEQNRLLRQSREGRTQGFEQFINRSELGEERTKLGIGRSREQEILQRQSQLATQLSGRQSAALGASEGAFREALGTGFSNFLSERGAG